MKITEAIQNLKIAIDEIRAFQEDCEESEYTDTEAAQDLLGIAESAMTEAVSSWNQLS